MRKLSVTAITLATAVFLWASSAMADISLRCAEEINRPAIRLTDLFDKVPEGIDRDIATAPQPGKSFLYDSAALNKLAQQYRLDWQSESAMERCIISRASARITQDMISNAVVEKIKSSAKELDNSQISIVFDGRGLEINLPTNQTTEFALNNFNYDTRNQHFKADLIAGEKGSQIFHPITGHASIKRDIPVLLERLEAKTIISEADLGWVTMASEHITPDMITSPTALLGRELRRDIQENKPLRARDIMQPRLVMRGNLVTMLVETPALRITSQGRALQDGGIGDTVRITNTQSKKVVEGTVTGQGTVKINVTEFAPPKQASVAQTNRQN